jgi:hypothetical protein
MAIYESYGSRLNAHPDKLLRDVMPKAQAQIVAGFDAVALKGLPRCSPSNLAGEAFLCGLLFNRFSFHLQQGHFFLDPHMEETQRLAEELRRRFLGLAGSPWRDRIDQLLQKELADTLDWLDFYWTNQVYECQERQVNLRGRPGLDQPSLVDYRRDLVRGLSGSQGRLMEQMLEGLPVEVQRIFRLGNLIDQVLFPLDAYIYWTGLEVLP